MSAARKLAHRARARDVDAARVRWPSPEWRGRIIEFARDVLGKRSLARHQVDILNAYYSADRVDIVGVTGQKLGKTETEIIIAANDFATVPRLEGLVVGPKAEHSAKVFWKRFCVDALAAYYPCRECMSAHRAWCSLVEQNPFDETPRPERCSRCSPLIPSTMKDPKRPELGRVSEWISVDSCERGLRTPDGRSIAAYVARKEGGLGGFSGNVRVYVDEASDVDDVVRRAIKGNMVGGGKCIAFGNLLHPHGWFARAFGSDRENFTHVFQISSRLSPNVPAGTVWSDGKVTPKDHDNGRPIPGMATIEGIESNLKEWRNAQNYIAARIDAEKPKVIEGQLAPMNVVFAAEQRWNDGVAGEGILQLGVDVARVRHRFAIAPRRGRRIFEIFAEVLGDEDYARAAILVRDMARKYRYPHERKPRVVFDKTGPEGKRFAKEIELYASELEIWGIEAGAPPRNVRMYYKRRDEIAHNFARWLRRGAIPTSASLEAEIEVTTAEEVPFRWKGIEWKVSQVILNESVEKLIGRSPDERNACELAVWDVDGSEPVLENVASNDGESPSPSLAAGIPRSNDVEATLIMSHYDRYAAAYGARA